MLIINFRIYKGFDPTSSPGPFVILERRRKGPGDEVGFDRENRSGCNFTHSVTIHGKIPYKFQTCYLHKIKIANTKLQKSAIRL